MFGDYSRGTQDDWESESGYGRRDAGRRQVQYPDRQFGHTQQLGAADAAERRRSGYAQTQRISEARRRPNDRSRASTGYSRDPERRTGGRSRYDYPSSRNRGNGYQSSNRYRASRQRPRKRSKKPILVAAIVVAVLAIGFGVWAYIGSLSVNVTVNGQELTVGGDKTVEAAYLESGLSMTPGDLLDVEGVVLESGEGKPFDATVNGEAVDDNSTVLSNGDVVEITDGSDTTEPYDSIEVAIPFGVTIEGVGALHVFEGKGVDGVGSEITGKISGKTVTNTITEPTNIVCRRYNADVGDDKVIALTFDDGPSSFTQEVLDVLAANDAKATFFTIGENVENKPDLVAAEAKAGHQVCTHTYDHADGSGKGVNLGYMTEEEQMAEIEKGYAANEKATGAEASRIIRTPGGNFSEETMRILQPYVDGEIGWNIDTRDWARPGAESIANAILSAEPGSVILCHDGGGDRSQTVEALKIALPELKRQGYSFITIDELLEYPAKEQ